MKFNWRKIKVVPLSIILIFVFVIACHSCNNDADKKLLKIEQLENELELQNTEEMNLLTQLRQCQSSNTEITDNLKFTIDSLRATTGKRIPIRLPRPKMKPVNDQNELLHKLDSILNSIE